jgi:transposase
MKSATTLTELELPWNRIERLQKAAGIPLAASVQWELCRDTLARGPLAAYQQLLWEAAQGDLLHNDDTHMRVLKWAANAKKGEPLREDAPGRSGVFTTSVLSVSPQRPTIALFFTGVAHCLNHARRNFVDLADSMIP